MKNPLRNYGMWHTPETFGEIQDLIAASGDAATGTTIMMLTINLCNELVERALAEAELEPYPEQVQPV